MAPDRKNVGADHAHLVLIDESGLLLNPLVRRTGAERGRPPVTGGDGGHRRKGSAIGAVGVSPAARRLGLGFPTLPDGYFDAPAVVAFLRAVLRHLRGNVVVVWDRGPNPTGPAIRAFPRRNRRLTLERLPAYAPDRNPVEVVWPWLGYGPLANSVPVGIRELGDEVVERSVGLRTDPGLLRVLWERSERPLPKQLNE